MKFLKQSLITTMLATLLATQTSAIRTDYGTLNVTCQPDENGAIRVRTDWDPEEWTLMVRESGIKAQISNKISGSGCLFGLWSAEHRLDWGPKSFEVTVPYSKTRCLSYNLMIFGKHGITINYWLGLGNIYDAGPMLYYNKSTKELTVTSILTAFAYAHLYTDFRDMCNNTRLIDKYIPKISTQAGPILTDAEVEITRYRAMKTVITIYKNVHINPEAKYFITPATEDDHIQLTAKIPVTIQSEPVNLHEVWAILSN